MVVAAGGGLLTSLPGRAEGIRRASSTPLESAAAGAIVGAIADAPGCPLVAADAAARCSVGVSSAGESMRIADCGAAEGAAVATSSGAVETGRATGGAGACRAELIGDMGDALDNATSCRGFCEAIAVRERLVSFAGGPRARLVADAVAVSMPHALSVRRVWRALSRICGMAWSVRPTPLSLGPRVPLRQEENRSTSGVAPAQHALRCPQTPSPQAPARETRLCLRRACHPPAAHCLFQRRRRAPRGNSQARPASAQSFANPRSPSSPV